MTRKQYPTIQLPPERLEQIKAIGVALGGLSTADTIGHLVREEIARGTISEDIPGVEIDRTNEGIVITLGDNPPARLTKGAARNLAESLAGNLNMGGAMKKNADDIAKSLRDDRTAFIKRQRELMRQQRTDIQQSLGLIVERRGNGLKIKMPSGSEKTFSRDLARDLARLVSKAAS